MAHGPEPDASEPRSLIKPGGKVDEDALRAAVEAQDADSDEERLQHVRFELSRDLNKRLDRYLVDRISFMSRTQLQKLIEVGGALVNDRPAKASTKLRLGDVVDVYIPPPPPKEIQGEDIPITVLFEDEHILVLNKQPDIIVHPARSHNRGTLLNALVFYLQNRSAVGGSLSGVGDEFARPGVVHRLDRHTSGVMVVAKTDEAHWKLARQFELRRTDKRYLALVEGVIETDADVIEAPIGPHPSRAKGMREKMTVRRDHLGKEAVTIYRVRQRFRAHTLVELELKTGRTHQIRVHLTHLGYPIVGDDMYEGHVLRASMIDPSLGDEVVMDRQALHAVTLGFAHPISGDPVVFTAPVRDEMAQAIAMLRDHADPSPVLEIPGATVDLDLAVPSAKA